MGQDQIAEKSGVGGGERNAKKISVSNLLRFFPLRTFLVV